jgi:hypothetical protein
MVPRIACILAQFYGGNRKILRPGIRVGNILLQAGDAAGWRAPQFKKQGSKKRIEENFARVYENYNAYEMHPGRLKIRNNPRFR